jgi:hypothetical protein
MKFLLERFSLPSVTFSLSGPNIILSILFSNNLILYCGSVYTFQREPVCATVGRLLLGNGSVNKPNQSGTIEDGVFRGVLPEAIQQEVPREQLLLEVERVLEMAVEGD